MNLDSSYVFMSQAGMPVAEDAALLSTDEVLTAKLRVMPVSCDKLTSTGPCELLANDESPLKDSAPGPSPPGAAIAPERLRYP